MVPVPGVYLAGDGAGIAGADAAELAGRRAALAVLEDMGIEAPRPDAALPDAATIEKRLERITRFRVGIEQAFAPPANCAGNWPDDLTICRCEEVDASTLRSCIRNGLATEVNRLKALTRIGMGRCQGRFCAHAGAEVIAAEARVPLEAVGRLRGQAPVKPLPMALSAAASGIDEAQGACCAKEFSV